MIYSEEELLNILNNAGLTTLKYEQYTDQSCIDLGVEDINVLIDYAKTNNIKHIFYRYNYFYKDEYMIDEYTWCDDEISFNDIITLAKSDISKYKRFVNSIDFEKPAVLGLICLHGGAIISMNFVEPWVKELEEPEAFLRAIKHKYFEQFCKLRDLRRKEKRVENEKKLEELKEVIFSNPTFSQCTNQRKRYAFINDLLNNPDNKLYRDVFINELNNFDTMKAKMYIDTLYDEYKIKTGKAVH